MLEELSIGNIEFKAFNLGGNQIDRCVWKDYYGKALFAKITEKMTLGGIQMGCYSTKQTTVADGKLET
ncbi:unnamed protein product [Urochloa humidicola]